MDQVKPDALLLYGDTNSCISVISAKRRKIPIFHMEAGNRCFDQRVPEEINRKIVDHLNIPLLFACPTQLVGGRVAARRPDQTESQKREVPVIKGGKRRRMMFFEKEGLKKVITLL